MSERTYSVVVRLPVPDGLPLTETPPSLEDLGRYVRETLGGELVRVVRALPVYTEGQIVPHLAPHPATGRGHVADSE